MIRLHKMKYCCDHLYEYW